VTKLSLINFLLNRFVIAAIISFAIILFLPDYFSKYELTLEGDENLKNSRVYYVDLNNDYKSEKIVYYRNSLNNACFMIYTSEGDLIDQFNFEGDFTNAKIKTLWFLDSDKNGYKEIYNITQRQDSVFLNIKEPFTERGINKKNIFIDCISPYNEALEVNESEKAFVLGDSNNSKILFTLYTGFAGNPRHAYAYDVAEDVLEKSEHLVNISTISVVDDFDGDKKKEILLKNHAASNTLNPEHTNRLDSSSWLTVLNQDLEFSFPPIGFKGNASSLKTNTISFMGERLLVVLFDSRQEFENPEKLYLYKPNGEKVKEVKLPSGLYLLFVDDKSNTIITTNSVSNTVSYFDNNLELIKSIMPIEHSYFYYLDLNNDGVREWLDLERNTGKVSIYTSDFKNTVKVQLPSANGYPIFYGLKRLDDTKSLLHLQQGNWSYLYDYKYNTLYPLKYVIYVLVYLSVLVLVWLIQKGQNLRNAKQRAIETEIAELQLKTIKNQVDPHFVFNAINTISEMTLMDNKLEADRFISRFSGFMRDTLQHSDKIATTLIDELDYVENFINLQRLRFNNAFDYTISIDKAVNKEFLVPKHVVFTFVENAIKHSLAFSKKGILTIKAKKTNQNLILVIEDNGLGLNPKLPKGVGTGNGLKIMDKLFKLYAKLYKRKIKYLITDLSTISEQTGLRVEVYIAI
jgi:hypothetical protein